MTKLNGVVAVYVVDDSVIASATDCIDQKVSGFDLFDSQKMRARDALYREVIDVYCSPIINKALENYACRTIVEKLPGAIDYIEISKPDPDEDKQ